MAQVLNSSSRCIFLQVHWKQFLRGRRGSWPMLRQSTRRRQPSGDTLIHPSWYIHDYHDTYMTHPWYIQNTFLIHCGILVKSLFCVEGWIERHGAEVGEGAERRKQDQREEGFIKQPTFSIHQEGFDHFFFKIKSFSCTIYLQNSEGSFPHQILLFVNGHNMFDCHLPTQLNQTRTLLEDRKNMLLTVSSITITRIQLFFCVQFQIVKWIVFFQVWSHTNNC